jgi:hypothetical protein
LHFRIIDLSVAHTAALVRAAVALTELRPIAKINSLLNRKFILFAGGLMANASERRRSPPRRRQARKEPLA